MSPTQYFNDYILLKSVFPGINAHTRLLNMANRPDIVSVPIGKGKIVTRTLRPISILPKGMKVAYFPQINTIYYTKEVDHAKNSQS